MLGKTKNLWVALKAFGLSNKQLSLPISCLKNSEVLSFQLLETTEILKLYTIILGGVESLNSLKYFINFALNQPKTVTVTYQNLMLIDSYFKKLLGYQSGILYTDRNEKNLQALKIFQRNFDNKTLIYICKSSRPEVFYNINALKNFAKFNLQLY